MSGTPSFGIALPQSFSATGDGMERLSRFLHTAEEGPFESLWVQEQLLGRDPSLEPLTSLAYAAAETSRLRLGTATVVAPLRDPILLAKTTASLDVMSGGRLILGLSIGEVSQIYDAVGVDMTERGRRLDESVEVLLSLWTDTAASYDGRFWGFDDVAMEPKPVQRPHPKLWFGGHSRAALRRVARSGTGWIGAGGSSLGEFAERVCWLEEELERYGRSRSEVTVAKKLYCAVDESPERARKGLETWFAQHWPADLNPVELGARAGVAGNHNQVGEAITTAIRGGADLIMLNPVFDEGLQLERLTELIHDLNVTTGASR